MKQQFIFCILYSYIVHLNANCVPKTTESTMKITIQKLTTVQTSSITPYIYYDDCKILFPPCSCMYTQHCKCLCMETETTTMETVKPRTYATYDNNNNYEYNNYYNHEYQDNLVIGQTDSYFEISPYYYSTTTTTACPNKCWCGFSNYYSCNCDCSFNLNETPSVALRWDAVGTDLDLHVIDPNGEEIYYSHPLSRSGGRFLKDIRTGPNAVEFISWGINQTVNRGPNGIYEVYVVAYRTSGRIPYSVAILEHPDQDWKIFNREITNYQRVLVYQFNISNTYTGSMNSEQSVNFTEICEFIYNAECDCGYDSNCNCACQLVSKSTISQSFNTATWIPNIYSTTTTTSTPYYYSTGTTTVCPNQCWCGLRSYNSCNCDCSLNDIETPSVALRWDAVGTDLDLHVIDPNGEEIYYSHPLSRSGGRFLKDIRTGPNAVEFISWGINQTVNRGPNGIYEVYVVAYRTSGRIPYSVAILEHPDQDWKIFYRETTNNQRVLVYQFNISNTDSGSLNAGQSLNLTEICEFIYNAECDCGYDSNCNCACQLVSRSTISQSFNTATWIPNIYSTTTTTSTPFYYSSSTELPFTFDGPCDILFSCPSYCGFTDFCRCDCINEDMNRY